jgi:hypothetical protein
MRLGSQLSSERAAGDFNKNVQYQQHQAEMPLEGARAEAPYYGSAVSGTVGLNHDLTQYGLQSRQFNFDMYKAAPREERETCEEAEGAVKEGATPDLADRCVQQLFKKELRSIEVCELPPRFLETESRLATLSKWK